MLSRGPDKTMLQGKWGSRKCLENAARENLDLRPCCKHLQHHP